MDDPKKFIQSGGTPIWVNDKGLEYEFKRDGIIHRAFCDWSEVGFRGFSVNEDGKFIIPYESPSDDGLNPNDKKKVQFCREVAKYLQENETTTPKACEIIGQRIYKENKPERTYREWRRKYKEYLTS